MLKASDLRIGNRLRPRRLLDPENIPPLGYMICAAQIAYSEEELNNDWEGVALTKDVIVKCGFEVKDLSFDSKSGQHHDVFLCLSPPFGLFHQNRLQLRFYDDRDALCWLVAEHGPTPTGTTVLTERIKYLHRIQNLYFALTGEELNAQL